MKKAFIFLLLLSIAGSAIAWDASNNRSSFTASEWKKHQERTQRYHRKWNPRPAYIYRPQVTIDRDRNVKCEKCYIDTTDCRRKWERGDRDDSYKCRRWMERELDE